VDKTLSGLIQVGNWQLTVGKKIAPPLGYQYKLPTARCQLPTEYMNNIMPEADNYVGIFAL